LKPAINPLSPFFSATKCNAIHVATNPPRIKKNTWMTSVYPITFIPPRVITTAKMASKKIQVTRLIPEILLTASAPRYRIDIRLTTIYNASQKIAMIIATVPLYR